MLGVGDRGWFAGPWVQQGCTGALEDSSIASYYHHIVDKGRRGDQAISKGKRIGDLKFGAAPSHYCIYGKNSTLECGKDLMFEPGAQGKPFRLIAVGSQ